jgi:hypothetical protein
MGDTVEDIAGQLRTLAVELVRDNKTADAMAVLVSIGAIEMLSTFAGDGGGNPEATHSPGY